MNLPNAKFCRLVLLLCCCASAAGAQSISIVGTEIVNSGFMRLARVAGRFGFEFTQINPTTIRLSGPVP